MCFEHTVDLIKHGYTLSCFTIDWEEALETPLTEHLTMTHAMHMGPIHVFITSAVLIRT